jgi:cellulose synthase (UDP-forming)
LFYGDKQNLRLHLDYRYDARLVARGSALRVMVNGHLVNEVDLPPGTHDVNRQRTVLIPVANLRPFGNTVVFNFDFVPANRDPVANLPLSGEILCNTALDLNGLALWARMPDLNLFAEAGFPFTRFADLSQTVVVLPTAPSSQEIALYLRLMSHFGAQTGYPALRVTVSAPSGVMSSEKDYLVLGTAADQPAFHALAPMLPATLDTKGVHIRHVRTVFASINFVRGPFFHRWLRFPGDAPNEDMALVGSSSASAIIEGAESPAFHDRSIIAIMLEQNSAADEFADAFSDPSRSAGINKSLSLLQDSTFKSYTSNVSTYHVGNVSSYGRMRIYLTEHFLILLVAVLTLSFLCAYYAHGWMAWRAHQRLKFGEDDRRSGSESAI